MKDKLYYCQMCQLEDKDKPCPHGHRSGYFYCKEHNQLLHIKYPMCCEKAFSQLMGDIPEYTKEEREDEYD